MGVGGWGRAHLFTRRLQQQRCVRKVLIDPMFGFVLSWTISLIQLVLTLCIVAVSLVWFYPAVIVNLVLSNAVKNPQTGAFDIQLVGMTLPISLTMGSIAITDLKWKNPSICGFSSPFFARIGSFSVTVSIISIIYALMDPANVIHVQAIEINDIELYVEKVAEENPGPSLNLWAALGSKDDSEAETVHSEIQSSMNNAKKPKKGDGGKLDLGGFMKMGGQQLDSVVDGLTTEGDDAVVDADADAPQHQAEHVKNDTEESAKVQPAKASPYKVQLGKFSIRQLTLHVPAYVGAAAPPIRLDGIQLTDLTNADGTSVSELGWKIVGQIKDQILSKNPMMALVGVIGGGLSGVLGGVTGGLDGLTGGLGGLGDLGGLAGGLGGLGKLGELGNLGGGGDLGGLAGGLGGLGEGLGGLSKMGEGEVPGGDMLQGVLGAVTGGAGGMGGMGGVGDVGGSGQMLDQLSGGLQHTLQSQFSLPSPIPPPPASASALPAHWSAHVDPASGGTFYVDERTGQSQWEPPAHPHMPSMPAIPQDMKQVTDSLAGAMQGFGGGGGFRF